MNKKYFALTLICAAFACASSSSSNQQKDSSDQQPLQDECEKLGYYQGTLCTCPQTGFKGRCEYGWGFIRYCKCTGDACENNPVNNGEKCLCISGKKGTCSDDYHSGVHRCACSNDECENNKDKTGQACHCSDTGKEGKCRFGEMGIPGNNGYRCECENQDEQQTSRSSNVKQEAGSSSSDTDNNNTKSASNNHGDNSSSKTDSQSDTISEYDAAVFSSNIMAPIYNLPLQRSMVPTTDCSGWWTSVTPFTQSNIVKEIHKLKNNKYEMSNTEGGVLYALGYYASWWHIRALASLAGSKTTYTETKSNKIFDDASKFGLLDGLIAFGLTTKKDQNWKLMGESFVGFSGQKVSKNISEQIIDVPSIGTGAQVNFDYVLSENHNRKYEFSALSRFTYFIPMTGKLHNAKNNSTDSLHYSPGAFLDLFIALKQYYGSDYQHQIDIGYNPTFHVINQSVKSEFNGTKIQKHVFTETIPSVRHTFYGTYGYNWDAWNMPMNISVGGSATFIPSINTYGTFFATFGLGF